ncbi:MAG: type I secretion system permease/ATPase [Rhodobacteraceae bacterium]|jgi:PrtD family type I secretion system ABC transporter|uniref:type I secretion system permease/ATPase n=1 Tax=Salipiger TaxID=263377 RepID=UPI0008E4A1EF|nr:MULTISPECIES: type I secretion system permease/ATPase [Salipiger]MAB04798.1 type I secretion system permease/ATPase [Paracoccaceae bacterium]GGA13577.1 protease/lipase ABC transporter permease/ATP-binding protein [Salipiger profundus]SFD18166.1 ATP-binding cassette, subfamily C [Salipiger profundus]
MQNRSKEPGRDELRAARRQSRPYFWFVAIFSFFVNLLMLTGPLYMLQIYDRVLGSRSEATLLALSVLVVFLYGMMGILDYARGRVMARVAARFQAAMDVRVFEAVMRRSAVKPDELAATGLKDLESVQRLMSSPVLMAFFDIPWTPFFIAGIFVFHPWLGVLALTGGLILVAVTGLNQLLSRKPTLKSNRAVMQAEHTSEQIRNEAEMVQSLGMRDAAFRRWYKARAAALKGTIGSADVIGTFTVITKTFRLFLQSAMLGLGAYLVLQNQLTPGAMIAGSILMGRALAPIELAIGQWPMVTRARTGWDNLAQLLSEVPPEEPRLPLPKPKALLEVTQATIVPPGEHQASLRLVSFNLMPGQALGVIGPSGAGKSTLARALTGVWRPAGGKIRLDGATLDQYGQDLGKHIGYLPQRVTLFDGSIAENIARLSEAPDSQAIVEAARKADAHEMILKLPDGYNTRVTAAGGRLSGGQMQRIGLARAMYGDPVILVLDEPNSNLDNEGSEAVNEAIRRMKAEGKSVIIMAHRPAAIRECDMLLMLENGARAAFGPKDEVLRSRVKNHDQIARNAGPGGVR